MKGEGQGGNSFAEGPSEMIWFRPGCFTGGKMTFRAGGQLATGRPVSNGMFNCELRLGFFMTFFLN